MATPHAFHRAVRQAIPTTTGTQDYTVPNFGTPKGAIVLLSRCSSDGTVQAHVGFSIGFHKVGGNTRTIAHGAEDNVANSNCCRTASNDKIAILFNTAATAAEVVGNFDSTVTDGIRINWTTVTGTGHLCTVILIGGNDAQVHVGSFDMADNTGTPNQTLDVTDAKFDPSYAIFTGCDLEAFAGSAPSASTVCSLGFASTTSGTVTQRCITYSDGDNRATSAPSSESSESSIFKFVRDASNTPLTVFDNISLDAWITDGFRVKDLVGSDPGFVHYIAVSAGNALAATVNSPTTGGGTATITPGFEPGSVFLLGTIHDAIAQKANDQAGQIGFGFASGFEEFSSSWFQEDANTTMNVGSLADDKILALTDHVGTVSLEANATFSDTVVTLTYPTVFGTARKQFALVIQEGTVQLDAPALTFLELDDFTPTGQLRLTAPALTFLELDDFTPTGQLRLTAPALTFLELDDFTPTGQLRLTAPALTFLELDDFTPNLRLDGAVGLQEAQLLPFVPQTALRLTAAQGTLELALFAEPQLQLRLAVPLAFLEMSPFTIADLALAAPVALTNKKRVYDAIAANVKASGGFRLTQYATTPDIKIIEGAAVAPQSIELNEIRSDYTIAERWRRSLKFQRDLWVWELILRFDKEVITELFEKPLLNTPLQLQRDVANGLESVTIIMDDTRWEHPPRMSPSNGTQVKYRFLAALGPV